MSFYKKIADFIVNDYKGCECSICNSIKNTGSNKCCEDEKNCITGVVDCLKEMFGGSEYTYIHSSHRTVHKMLPPGIRTPDSPGRKEPDIR